MIRITGRLCLIATLNTVVILLALLASSSSYAQLGHNDNELMRLDVRHLVNDYDLYAYSDRIQRSSLGCMNIPFPAKLRQNSVVCYGVAEPWRGTRSSVR